MTLLWGPIFEAGGRFGAEHPLSAALLVTAALSAFALIIRLAFGR